MKNVYYVRKTTYSPRTYSVFVIKQFTLLLFYFLLLFVTSHLLVCEMYWSVLLHCRNLEDYFFFISFEYYIGPLDGL